MPVAETSADPDRLELAGIGGRQKLTGDPDRPAMQGHVQPSPELNNEAVPVFTLCSMMRVGRWRPGVNAPRALPLQIKPHKKHSGVFFALCEKDSRFVFLCSPFFCFFSSFEEGSLYPKTVHFTVFQTSASSSSKFFPSILALVPKPLFFYFINVEMIPCIMQE